MAEILHEFHRRRADISYHPIVGSGPNSCVLHYRDNGRQMQDGELLLIDAGCEYDYYASDVTRTLPVGGRYGRRQRAVYEIVLEAQKAAIAKVRAGGHWNDPHEAAVRAITAGPRSHRPAEGPGPEAHQGRRLPAVLHASRRALARHGCPRRRRIQGRRAMAAARAGHGHDHRARHLHRAGHEGRAPRMVGHRRSHRGRRRRDQRASRKCSPPACRWIRTRSRA